MFFITKYRRIVDDPVRVMDEYHKTDMRLYPSDKRWTFEEIDAVISRLLADLALEASRLNNEVFPDYKRRVDMAEGGRGFVGNKLSSRLAEVLNSGVFVRNLVLDVSALQSKRHE